MTKKEASEVAHVLVEIGNAIYYFQKKSYTLARGAMDGAGKRLRFLLKVEGEDEKRSG